MTIEEVISKVKEEVKGYKGNILVVSRANCGKSTILKGIADTLTSCAALDDFLVDNTYASAKRLLTDCFNDGKQVVMSPQLGLGYKLSYAESFEFRDILQKFNKVIFINHKSENFTCKFYTSVNEFLSV